MKKITEMTDEELIKRHNDYTKGESQRENLFYIIQIENELGKRGYKLRWTPVWTKNKN